MVKHAHVLKYADDSVLYIGGKNLKDISNLLSIDLSSISRWFKVNELLMNLKQGKTEALLFGTSRKVAQNIKDLYSQRLQISMSAF